MKPTTITYAAALLILAAGLAACAGFDLGDVVKAKTPQGIQKSEGLPSTLSLNDAELEYEAWLQDVQREGATWRANIERADEIAGLFGSLTLGALDSAGPVIMGLPLGGAALPALTGIVGLFVGARGQAKEKERSYNKGQQVGAKMARGAE